MKGTLGGAYVRMALDQTNWDAATRLVNEWVEAGMVGQVTDMAGQTVSEAVAAFLKDARTRELQPATLGKYALLLERRLTDFCMVQGVIYLRDLNLDLVTRFRSEWPGGALAKSKTQERLRAFFGWCVARTWISENPAKGLSPLKVVTVPTLPFTTEEMERILDAVERYPEKFRDRARAFVLLLRWSGLRIRDVVTIERERIKDGRLFLRTQKTGTVVHVPLPDQVIQAVAKLDSVSKLFWKGQGLPKSAVANWQRTLRKIFRVAHVNDAHAHRFRDTFAVELLLKGAELSDVSILLGHSSIRITEKHYAPWVRARQIRLESVVRGTWGSSTTVEPQPTDTPAPRPTSGSVIAFPVSRLQARDGTGS